MPDSYSHSTDYPRVPRKPLEGAVLIKRPGKETIKCKKGNISDIGIYLELKNHDLQKGRRVDVIFVSDKGSVKDINRMYGIVLRINSEGVALMVYHPKELRKTFKDDVKTSKSTVHPLKTS